MKNKMFVGAGGMDTKKSREWNIHVTGAENSPSQGSNSKMHMVNGDCRLQKPNPEHFCRLEIPAKHFFFFLTPKGDMSGKERIHGNITILYIKSLEKIYKNFTYLQAIQDVQYL